MTNNNTVLFQLPVLVSNFVDPPELGRDDAMYNIEFEEVIARLLAIEYELDIVRAHMKIEKI